MGADCKLNGCPTRDEANIRHALRSGGSLNDFWKAVNALSPEGREKLRHILSVPHLGASYGDV